MDEFEAPFSACVRVTTRGQTHAWILVYLETPETPGLKNRCSHHTESWQPRNIWSPTWIWKEAGLGHCCSLVASTFHTYLRGFSCHFSSSHLILYRILHKYALLPPLEVVASENVVIFQANISLTCVMWPDFGKFKGLASTRGQVTASEHRSQHRGQTAQQRTELCPTALGVMLGRTAITLLLHNTGALTKIHTPCHLSALTCSAITDSVLVGLHNYAEQVGPWSAPVPPKEDLKRRGGSFTPTVLVSQTTAREWEHHIYSKLPHRQDGTSVFKVM